MKISTATLTEKVRIIASLEDWLYVAPNRSWPNPYWAKKPENILIAEEELVKHFLLLDNIVPVVRKLKPRQLAIAYKHLCDTFDGEAPENWINADPSMLIDAILLATEKATR